jgi:hypothetical protein
MELMPDRRLFSEAEISTIIERAIKLQEENVAAKSYTPGVTREELGRIAAELGVEPQFLQQAILDQLRPATGNEKASLYREERVVDGEVDPSEFDLMLEQIRTVNTRHHPTQQFGRTLRTQALAGGGFVNVEVTARNGRTRIKAASFPVLQILGTFYPAFLGSIFAGTKLASMGQPLAGAAVSVGLFGAAALGFRAWSKAARKGMHTLVNRLADWASAHGKTEEQAPVATEAANELQIRVGEPHQES